MAIRRKPKTLPILFFILILLSVIGFGGYYGWIHWSRNVAIRTVQDFYAAEQGGDYGKAWTMLHSDMKKKFNQSEYIQKRTALFIDSFGAKTFSYKIDEVDHLKRWRMTKDSPYIKDVYKITVIQTLVGVFGEVKLYKDVFVTKEKNEWKMLWKY